VDIVEAEPALVAHPFGIDRLVVARRLAINKPFAAADDRIAARGAAGADAFGFLEEPDAHLEAEILAGERADGADIDGVERVIIVEPLARMDGEGGVTAAVDEAEDVVVDHFLGETDAARAHDAAFVVEDDAFADVDALRLLHLFVGEAAALVAILDRVFLKLAFAGLIADGAVERVVDEEKFHDALAAFLDHGRVGADAHALGDLRGAADLRLIHPGDLGMVVGGHDHLAGRVHFRRTDFNEAHAAVAGDGKLGVVTIMGNKFAHAAGDFDDVESLGKLHPGAVDLHVEERSVGGREIVIERIFHGLLEFTALIQGSCLLCRQACQDLTEGKHCTITRLIERPLGNSWHRD